MPRTMKAVLLVLALVAAAGACGRDAEITAPPAPGHDVQAPPPPDLPQGDTTGRWGGMIGSGG